MADDPSRWSHSTGESQEFRDRHATTSTRSSAYSGVEEEAGIGFMGNATDLSLALSSGDAAKKKRDLEAREQEEANLEAKWAQEEERHQEEEEGHEEEARQEEEGEVKEQGKGTGEKTQEKK